MWHTALAGMGGLPEVILGHDTTRPAPVRLACALGDERLDERGRPTPAVSRRRVWGLRCDP